MRKVITYGTFDLFHKGHYNILKRAKEEGDYLIVGVTSESYDIERGKLSVQDSLSKRIENVKSTGFVDEIIIEEYLGQKIRDVIKYNIDVLVIGNDWYGKFDHLKKYCEVRYLERTKDISSTQLREEKNTIYNIGVVIDENKDDDIADEIKFVSGFHAESVFCSKKAEAMCFAQKYYYDKYFDDYDAFLQSVDIVIVKTAMEQRYDQIKTALEAGKNVVANAPFTMDIEKQKELQELAAKKNCFLLDNIVTVYLRAFTQIMWMTQGNLIGDVVTMKISISDDSFDRIGIQDLTALPIVAALKIMGSDFIKVKRERVKGEDGKTNFISISFIYENSIVALDVGYGIELENQMVITGTNGDIVVKDDWWNTGYFELHNKGEKYRKKFSFNFEGTGFRYVLQEIIIMLRDGRNESARLFPEESVKVVELLSEF